MHILVLVTLIEEHCEWDDEEDENSIDDIYSEPQILHRQGKVAGTIVDGVPAGLPVGDVGRQHEDGDSGHGEAEDDHELGEVGLIRIVGMLVVDEEVDIEDEDKDAHYYRDDHESEVEIAHLARTTRLSTEIRPTANRSSRTEPLGFDP